ncbi:hypothetical protein [Stenotrophomonas acidaminiphila]|uniref:Lar family restriction alleviation protein n=1 Tax=Stenotrophomonas acidaminiphila TaxID=128780 RepID=UPI0028AE5ED0|nr:hypothetical protein [Stenotrophomonas acidaminiphila]
MNAHNEQHALPCPFCGAEPDLSFNSVSCGCAASPFIDREDALQVWNTRAAQPSPVVKQNLTTQPAAAQEAVAWQRRYIKTGGPWYSISKEIYETTKNGEWAGRYEVRELYAAPVTAAPADAEEDAYVIDQMGKLLAEIAVIVNGPEPAGTRWSYHDLPAKVQALATTPAAPGIDLEPFRRLVEWNYDSEFSAYENGFRTEEQREVAEAERKRLLALIDASPKGERVSNPDELAFAARGFLGASFAPSAEESTREMRDTYSYWHRRLLRAAGGAMDYEQATDTAADSPKGGTMNEQFGSAEGLGSPKGDDVVGG